MFAIIEPSTTLNLFYVVDMSLTERAKCGFVPQALEKGVSLVEVLSELPLLLRN